MLQMMTDLEDEEDWAMEDEVEDVDSDVSTVLLCFVCFILTLPILPFHIYIDTMVTSIIS